MRKMGLPAIKDEEHWTYAHYKTWPDDERWELIHGVAYNMSAAPMTNHQILSGYVEDKLSRFLGNKPCRMFHAPFDVFLPAGAEDEDDIDTVVQPDIVVICDESKLNEKGCRGAPDLVVEILSPSTSRKDQHEKFALYQEKGVGEYWVADPRGRWFTQYVLGKNGLFDNGTVIEDEKDKPAKFLECRVLAGFRLNIAECFSRLL